MVTTPRLNICSHRNWFCNANFSILSMEISNNFILISILSRILNTIDTGLGTTKHFLVACYHCRHASRYSNRL